MKNRKRNRMLGFDYSQNAVYFVTSCCKNRIHHFGEVHLGKMNLSEFGFKASFNFLSFLLCLE